LHWEAHIIKRPDEAAPLLGRDEIAMRFRQAVEAVHKFELSYRGFFISSEGTIAFQGYGETADLRRALREALPFSSNFQSEIGHISVARILDPLGVDAFRELLKMRAEAESESFGALPVQEVKLVQEQRWYMEDHEIVAAARLR
jgi:hypothetical protein